MDRRGFLKAVMGAALVAPTASNRVYSFLWNNPLAPISYDVETAPLDLILSSSPITSRPRKLRARWSLEISLELDEDRKAAARHWADVIDREIITGSPRQYAL